LPATSRWAFSLLARALVELPIAAALSHAIRVSLPEFRVCPKLAHRRAAALRVSFPVVQQPWHRWRLTLQCGVSKVATFRCPKNKITEGACAFISSLTTFSPSAQCTNPEETKMTYQIAIIAIDADGTRNAEAFFEGETMQAAMDLAESWLVGQPLESFEIYSVTDEKIIERVHS
jgi:hypothetical protein